MCSTESPFYEPYVGVLIYLRCAGVNRFLAQNVVQTLNSQGALSDTASHLPQYSYNIHLLPPSLSSLIYILLHDVTFYGDCSHLFSFKQTHPSDRLGREGFIPQSAGLMTIHPLLIWQNIFCSWCKTHTSQCTSAVFSDARKSAFQF